MEGTDFSYLTAFFIFITYVIIDVLYALYIIYVEKRNAMLSATISAIMYGFIAYGVVNYSKNPYYIIPLIIGAWLGTFIVVKFKK
jgi:hypothetical protein